MYVRIARFEGGDPEEIDAEGALMRDGIEALRRGDATTELPARLAQVTSRPDVTIAELRAWLLETHKVSVSTGLMNKTLAALDLTFKKSPSMLPSKRVRMLPRPVSNGASSSRS